MRSEWKKAASEAFGCCPGCTTLLDRHRYLGFGLIGLLALLVEHARNSDFPPVFVPFAKDLVA